MGKSLYLANPHLPLNALTCPSHKTWLLDRDALNWRIKFSVSQSQTIYSCVDKEVFLFPPQHISSDGLACPHWGDQEA